MGHADIIHVQDDNDVLRFPTETFGKSLFGPDGLRKQKCEKNGKQCQSVLNHKCVGKLSLFARNDLPVSAVISRENAKLRRPVTRPAHVTGGECCCNRKVLAVVTTIIAMLITKHCSHSQAKPNTSLFLVSLPCPAPQVVGLLINKSRQTLLYF